MNRTVRLGMAAVVATGVLLGGCTMAGPEQYPLISQPQAPYQEPDIKQIVYTAADAMLYNLGDQFKKHQAIVPTTYVQQDDLTKSSTLGRLLANQMASRFSQHGYTMRETKLRKDLLIQQGNGEFMLTREMKKMRHNHKLHAVLAGSYVVTRNHVEVSTRLIRLKDQRILTSYDFTLPLNHDVRSLLNTQK